MPSRATSSLRTPLLWLLIPLITGLVIAKGGPAGIPISLLLGLAAISGGLGLWAAGRDGSAARRWWAAGLIIAMLLAGWAYFHQQLHRLADWEGLPPREALVTLEVGRLFSSRDPIHRSSGLGVITAAPLSHDDLVGQKVYFSLWLKPGKPRPVRSAAMEIIGRLEAIPRESNISDFDRVLANAGANFKITRARALSVTVPSNAYRRFCEHLNVRLNKILSVGLNRVPALAGIYRAMMLGQKQDLSAGQTQLFIHSGTMHLFAINGLHIGVVAVSIHALLMAFRFPRTAAAILVLIFLWLDVDTTGASPSAVRAFLMVAYLETAWALRLPLNPLAALALSALVILLLDPMALFSASFQMSYGVVTILLTLGLPLAARLKERFPPFRFLPERSWRWHHRMRAWLFKHFCGAISIAWAATLTSAVTGVAFFHVFAPIGLGANLILVPLASLVIAAGVASIVMGLAGLTVMSDVFNHAAAMVLWAIDWLVRLGVYFPKTYWTAEYRASWIGPLALAALLATCLAGTSTGWQRVRGGFWPPVLVVVATLSLGVKFG